MRSPRGARAAVLLFAGALLGAAVLAPPAGAALARGGPTPGSLGGAYAVGATGALTIAPTPNENCPPDGSGSLATLNLGASLGTATGLTASCATTGSSATSSASVASADLLAGALQVGAVQSSCSPSGSSSSVATVNGTPVGTTPATIPLPGVGTVYANETTTNGTGQVVQNAVRVVVDQGVPLIGGEEIVLAQSRCGAASVPQTPEAPYAALLPAAGLMALVLLYARRRRRAAR